MLTSARQHRRVARVVGAARHRRQRRHCWCVEARTSRDADAPAAEIDALLGAIDETPLEIASSSPPRAKTDAASQCARCGVGVGAVLTWRRARSYGQVPETLARSSFAKPVGQAPEVRRRRRR